MAEQLSTRERIVREATRLFADQGYKATTVAQIEAAVGLRKGSGGVHRHFPTKEALLEAVLDEALAKSDQAVATAESWQIPEPAQIRAYLQLLGHYALSEISQHRDLGLILLRDAASLPDAIRREHPMGTYSQGFSSIADSLRSLAKETGQDLNVDPDAFGFLLTGPFVLFRIIEWFTGVRVLDISDEQLIDTWATIFEPALLQLGEFARDQTHAPDHQDSR